MLNVNFEHLPHKFFAVSQGVQIHSVSQQRSGNGTSRPAPQLVGLESEDLELG